MSVVHENSEPVGIRRRDELQSAVDRYGLRRRESSLVWSTWGSWERELGGGCGSWEGELGGDVVDIETEAGKDGAVATWLHFWCAVGLRCRRKYEREEDRAGRAT